MDIAQGIESRKNLLGLRKALAIMVFAGMGVVWICSNLKTVPHWAWDADISGQSFSGATTIYRGDPVRYFVWGRYLGSPFKIYNDLHRTKADHNFLMPYLMAATWAFNHGRISTQTGRFYVALFQVASVACIGYYLAAACGIGWELSLALCLFIILSPWSVEYGKIANGEAAVPFLAAAFSCLLVSTVTSRRFADGPVPISMGRYIAMFLLSFLGVLTEYYFWTFLGVVAVFLLIILAFRLQRWKTLIALLFALTTGALLAVGALALDFKIMLKSSWWTYLAAEHHEHRVNSGSSYLAIPSYWTTFLSGLRLIKENYANYFPRARFYTSATVALFFLAASFIAERKSRGSAWCLILHQRWQAHKIYIVRMASLFFLWGGSALLWCGLVCYQFGSSPEHLVCLVFPFSLLFGFLMMIALMAGPLFRVVPFLWILIALVNKTLLIQTELYQPHLWRDLPISARLARATQSKIFGHYPKEMDLIEATRLSWNVSYGHRDFQLRYPSSLIHVEIPADMSQRITHASGYDGEPWGTIRLIQQIWGTEVSHYLVAKRQNDPFDVCIVDPRAQPVNCRISVFGAQKTRQNYIVWIATCPHPAAVPSRTVWITANTKEPSFFDRLLDGSREKFLVWAVDGKLVL